MGCSYTWEFYLLFYEALYVIFQFFVIGMQGYRKLGMGQIVSREENFFEDGKHLSALGSNTIKY